MDMSVIYMLLGFVAGAFVEFMAIVAGMSWLDRRKSSRDGKASPVIKLDPSKLKHPPDYPIDGIPIKETAVKIPDVQPPAPVPVSVSIPLTPVMKPKFGQLFWYYVKGQTNPYSSLLEALSTFPVERAKYKGDNRPQWDNLPKAIKELIRREEIGKAEKGKEKSK